LKMLYDFPSCAAGERCCWADKEDWE
jgi:hypothetical protein